MGIDRLGGDELALAGPCPHFACVAGGEVYCPFLGLNSCCSPQLVFRDIGELVTDLNIAPGTEVAVKGALELGLGGPGVLKAHGQVQLAIQESVESIVCGQLQTLHSNRAAIELITDFTIATG